jgi:hypothetical protein
VLSPAAPLARSLSVVAKAGKGYKMKTHKVLPIAPSRPRAGFAVENPSVAFARFLICLFLLCMCVWQRRRRSGSE